MGYDKGAGSDPSVPICPPLVSSSLVPRRKCMQMWLALEQLVRMGRFPKQFCAIWIAQRNSEHTREHGLPFTESWSTTI